MPTAISSVGEPTTRADWRSTSDAHTQFPSLQFPGDRGALAESLPPGMTSDRDRTRQFVMAACSLLKETLVRCEERYPGTGHHSLLYVVVETLTLELESQLRKFHEELFDPEHDDPLAPVHLVVVDRATDSALDRLVDLGVARSTARASRIVWPADSAQTAASPLSPAETQKAALHRQRAAHQFKVSRVLAEGGLTAEARTALLEAILSLSRALATEQRLPEPDGVCESLLPPFALIWGTKLALLRRFATDPEDACEPVLQALSTSMQSPCL